MYRVILANKESLDILCMSNIRGVWVKNPYPLPFSFYFSRKSESDSSVISHGPRVKVAFKPNKVRESQTGTLKLCDDWEFIANLDDKHVSSKDIASMKSFFRMYLVLFCAVWEDVLDSGLVVRYFEGQSSLADLVEDLDFYQAYKDVLDKVKSVEDLENICQKYNLINFYGN